MLYLAITAAQMEQCSSLPPHIAWSACTFSSRNSGLTNLPKQLPQGCVIMVNDQQPIAHHDPQLVTRQLLELAEEYKPEAFLLDFQRPGGQAMVHHLVAQLPITTGVSQQYAEDLTCPIFLAPHPLCRPFVNHWPGRELWQDAPICNQTVTVTKAGTELSQWLPFEHITDGFYHSRLGVHYRIRRFKDRIEFSLSRSAEDLNNPQISRYFCLYNEYCP